MRKHKIILLYLTLPVRQGLVALTKITKKDKIIKRLAMGDDPTLIAGEEKTSRSYVYKISSENAGIIQQSQDRKNNGNDSTDQNFNLTQKYESQFSREDRKKIYNEFYTNHSDVEIVLKYGWDPNIIRREREAYYELSSFKPHEFQENLLRALRKSEYEIDHILNRNKLISSQELINFVLYFLNEKINNIANNFSINPPVGWTKPKCMNCKTIMPGLLYNSSMVPGNINLLYSSHLCVNCSRLRK